MATYSTNLKITLPANGSQAGTWGDTTNNNLGTLIEQAISGYTTVDFTSGSPSPLTMDQGASCTARNMYLELQNATADGVLTLPPNNKLYFIYNNTNYTITAKISGQTGVAIPSKAKYIVTYNGTDIVNAVTSNLSYTGATNYVPKFSSSSALTSSTIRDYGFGGANPSGVAINGPAQDQYSILTVNCNDTNIGVGNVNIQGAGGNITISPSPYSGAYNVIAGSGSAGLYLQLDAGSTLVVGGAGVNAIVNGKATVFSFNISSPSTPASSSATGSPGDIAWDSNYVYVCVATNTWKRAALATW